MQARSGTSKGKDAVGKAKAAAKKAEAVKEDATKAATKSRGRARSPR